MAKRAAQGTGTIREKTITRGDKEYTFWEARITVDRDPGTGRQIQKSITGKTQKEVRQKMQEMAVAVNHGTYQEPSKLTVGEWLDIWLSEYTNHVKTRTKLLYQGHIEYRLKPALGAVKLSALNAPTIQAFYNKQLKEHDGKAPLAPKTLKNLHGVFHKALNQAVELRYLPRNPADSCKLPKAPKAEIKPLDEKEIALFLEAIQGHPFEALFLVDLFTGMRQGEVLGLTWDCIDFEKGTITLYRQLQRVGHEFQFTTLKNGKTRHITPAPFVMQILKKQRRNQAELQLKAGAFWQNKEGLVFTNELGQHLNNATVYKNYKHIASKIGLSGSRFHDLRHSYAVAALQSGDDVKTVQENLGHHTAAFTLDVYGHVTEQMKQASAQRMNTSFRAF